MSSSSAVARRWALGLPVNELALNRRGDVLAASLGDGSVRLWPADDTADRPKIISVHDGVSLSLRMDADDHAFLSGGDDGRVVILDPELDVPTEISHLNSVWIDHVAGSVCGFRAFTCGKNVHLVDPCGETVGQPRTLPSHAGGVSFSPNGVWLAACYKDGVSLFDPLDWGKDPLVFSWDGAHQDVFWSPDSAFVFTSLRDGALHGWRSEDRAEMQMHGYMSPVRSAKFTVDSKFLATSGADRIVCWPMTNGGPWNQKPLMLGGTDSRLVTQVAPHPKDPLVAAGYDDGMIVLAPLDGRMEIMVQPPSMPQRDAITGLTWNAYGDCLFASMQNQTVLLFTTKSIRGFVG